MLENISSRAFGTFFVTSITILGSFVISVTWLVLELYWLCRIWLLQVLIIKIILNKALVTSLWPFSQPSLEVELALCKGSIRQNRPGPVTVYLRNYRTLTGRCVKDPSRITEGSRGVEGDRTLKYFTCLNSYNLNTFITSF